MQDSSKMDGPTAVEDPKLAELIHRFKAKVGAFKEMVDVSTPSEQYIAAMEWAKFTQESTISDLHQYYAGKMEEANRAPEAIISEREAIMTKREDIIAEGHQR
jgi:hypothetical protein